MRRPLRGIARRSPRSSTRAAAIVAAKQVLAGGLMLDADHYIASGANVASFVDLLDPTHLMTVTGTLAAPASDAGYGGSTTASFTGTQYATSNRTASAWTLLNSSFDAITVLTPTDTRGTNSRNAVLATGTTATTSIGCNLAFYGTTLEDSGFIVTANHASQRICDLNGGALVANTPTYLRWSYVEGASPECQYWLKAASLGSQLSNIAPSASTPTSTLILGADPGGGATARMAWRATYVKPGRFTAVELAVITRLILLETGLS